MQTSKSLSFGCLMVLAVLAVPGVAADWPIVSPSNNEVYLADPPPARPSFSRARARNMSETTDLREFIMKYVQDERICSMSALRDFILAEDGSDERAKVWWSRRCGGRRGGAPSFPASQSPESTLIRYRRKSSNRDSPQNSLDRSNNDKKRLKKINKLMTDKRLRCKPKRKAVPLPNPDPSITLHPECVYIRQCSGCCSSDKLECLPTRNKTKTFPAMVVRVDHGTYRMDQNPIKMVKVVEHKECSCECKVREEHCTPSQVYVENACQCQCPQHSREPCPSRKQTWSDKNCRCECTKPKNCTTGRYFDVNTCRCLRP